MSLTLIPRTIPCATNTSTETRLLAFPTHQATKPPIIPARPTGEPMESAARNVLRQPVPPEHRPKILFYHKTKPYYGFTNFSPHLIDYRGKRYPTSEHLFQLFKVGSQRGQQYLSSLK